MPSAGEQATAQGPSRLASVRRVADERAYLYELIQTIGAGPDLEMILRGVVRLVTEATSCHACFVYFIGEEQLTLRVASAMYEHLEGHVAVPIGEGLTGWVARTRRSAFIKERALDDPRVRRAYFPELGDEVYQSLVSVPIFSRAGDVTGVITLHAEAPHEFGRADLDFLEHTASLITGAVENARLYEDATARIAMLSDLSQLSRSIASAGDQDELLRVVAEGLRALLGASRCEIHLNDADDRARLAIGSPERPAAGDGPTQEAGPTEDLGPGGSELWEARDGEVFASLVAGEERLGYIGVRLPHAGADARSALAAVAAHTAVALKQHQAIDRLREKNLLKDFFQALATGDPSGEASGVAADLRRNLDAPHVALHAALGRSVGDIEALLAARFPGALVDVREGSVRAIVPLEDTSYDELVGAVRRMDWGETAPAGALSVGLSDPCRGAASFARAFVEAESAAEVGKLIRKGPGVTTHEELGPYRYLLGADEEVRDGSQRRLELLVDYDARRGTRLLDTLEGYFDHRGNVMATSRALFIHPNTLRQRLDRIEQLMGVDLASEEWLSLAVATKIVKLRRMRRSAEGGNDG